MTSTRPAKVLAVSCGGTWCMRQGTGPASHVFGTHRVPFTLGRTFDFNSTFPGVSQFAEITFYELEALDSSNMGPGHWAALTRYIGERAEKFDGFVVLQGTDTLAFTAAALA